MQPNINHERPHSGDGMPGVHVPKFLRNLTGLLAALALHAPLAAGASDFSRPWQRPGTALVIDAYEYNAIDWAKLVTDKRIAGFINKASDGLPPAYRCSGNETEVRAEIDGREVSRRVTVPARSTVRVTVFFDVPDAFESRGRWDIELRVTTDGFGATDSRPASITRGRDGARKWAAPKR